MPSENSLHHFAHIVLSLGYRTFLRKLISQVDFPKKILKCGNINFENCVHMCHLSLITEFQLPIVFFHLRYRIYIILSDDRLN